MRESERIPHIDGLRGVAIVFVIMFHAYARWPEFIPWTTQYKEFPIFKFGYMGVQLFFMISGFVIHMTLERCSSFSEFILRRWIRLFPAMLAVTLIVFFSADHLSERPAGIPNRLDVISGLLFIEPEILNKVFGLQLSSIEGAFWSLYVEVKFYLIYGAIYFLNKKRSIQNLIALFLFGFLYKTTIALNAISEDIFGGELLFTFLSLNHFGWFCIGALLYLQKKHGSWQYILWASVLLMPALSMSDGEGIGSILFGFLIYIIFSGSILTNHLSRFLSNKFFLFFGTISYPLYLIHENAMVSLTMKVHATVGWLPDILTPIPGLMVILLTSHLIARHIEPFIKNKINFIKHH